MGNTLGINGSLYMAANALSAQRAAIEVTGNNIANVNTKGYARQRVVLEPERPVTLAMGPQGFGVNAAGIEQLRDMFLDLRIPANLSSTSYLGEKSNLLKQLQSNLGQSLDHTNAVSGSSAVDSSDGLSAALDSFFNSFQSLSNDPTSVALRQQVLLSAQNVATKLNTIYSSLNTFQDQIEASLPQSVTDVNDKLASIAALNHEIQGTEAGGNQHANELRDQRQLLIEEVSQVININVTNETDNSVTIRLGSSSGTLLVQEQFAGDVAGQSTVKLRMTGFKSSLALQGTTNGGAVVGVTQPTSGSLAASIEISKTMIGDATSTSGLIFDYNNIARSLATQVNTLHGAATSFTLEGSPAYATQGNPTFFDDDAVDGNAIGVVTAQNIQLNVAVAADYHKVASSDTAGQPTNGNQAKAIANVRSALDPSLAVAPGISVINFYLNSVGNLGTTIRTTDAQLSTQNLISQSLNQQRDAVSGVSIDEETTNLLRFQHAYEANARVMNTIDEMMKVLLAVGR